MREVDDAEAIVRAIQDRIRRGDLKPGDRLPPERQLAAMFDASRKEASPEDMGYAPSTTAAELEGIGVPRAKRTPRVYEPEPEEEEEDLGVEPEAEMGADMKTSEES